MKKIMTDKAINEVDVAYCNLLKMNIPKLQLDCAFSRKEIYMIYAKFKALSKISKVNFPQIVKGVIGVEKSVFINCM